MLPRALAVALICCSGILCTSCGDDELPQPKKANEAKKTNRLAAFVLQAMRASDDVLRFEQLSDALWHKVRVVEWSPDDLAGIVIDAAVEGAAMRDDAKGPIGRALSYAQEVGPLLRVRVLRTEVRDHPSREREEVEVAARLAAALRAGDAGTLHAACAASFLQTYGMSELVPALEHVLVHDKNDAHVLAAAVALLGRDGRTMPKTDVLLAHLFSSDSRVATAAAIGLADVRGHLSDKRGERIMSLLKAADTRAVSASSTLIDQVAAIYLETTESPLFILHKHF